MNRRGQITVFIIIAVLLVAAIALIFLLYERQLDSEGRVTQRETPGQYEDCINEYVSEAVELIFENSGYVEPSSFTYRTRNIDGYYKEWPIQDVPYLCYTGMNYARCISQVPFFVDHLEKEIYDYIEPNVERCFESLVQDLKESDFDVEFGETKNLKVSLSKNVVQVSLDKSFVQEHAGEEQRFESFNTRYNTPLYGMTKVTERIINEEITWCNSDYVDIMRANPDFAIDKFQTGEAIKVYRVEDINTDNLWTFAIRNCVASVPS